MMLRYQLALILVLPLQAQTALELADKLPAPSVAEGQAVLADLVKLGAPGLLALADGLVPAGTGDDTKVRFALAGLAHYVSRPRAEADRALFSNVLLGALAARTEAEVRADLIRFLQPCGGPEAVAPLGALLHDDQLSAPAAAALLTIGGEAAAQAFVAALPNTTGSQAVTMLEAIGRLGAKAAVPQVILAASAEDRLVRQAAWNALSRLGDTEAIAVLLAGSMSDDVRDRTVATAACLRLAEGLPRGAGVTLCRELLASHAGEGETHVAADALTTLVRLIGDAAAPDLFTAIAGPYADLRRTAADLLVPLPSDGVLPDILAKAREGAPAVRAEMIRVLRLRGETSAAELFLQACTDPDPLVRDAALQAAATLATPEAVQSIAKAAAATPGDAGWPLAELLRQLPAERVLGPVLALWPKAEYALKIVVLDLLVARGGPAQRAFVVAALADEDPFVRQHAIAALGAVSGTGELPDLLRRYLAADETEREDYLNAAVRTARREPDLEAHGKPIQDAFAAADPVGRKALLEFWWALEGAVAMRGVLAALHDPAEPVATFAREILNVWQGGGEINLAERRPVTTSVPHQGGNVPERAVDGDSADKAGSAWFGSPWPCWLQVDLGAAVPLDAVQVWFYWDARTYQYTIDVSADGQTWQTVVDAKENATPATAEGVTHRFAPTLGRYVRLNVLKNSANEAVHVVELKAFAAGTLPAAPE